MTDREALVRELARDLDGHFEELVLDYQDTLYRFALRLTNCAADAEDVTQDAFVRAYTWLKGHPPEPDFQLRPWLYRVTLNVIRNRVRRKTPDKAPLEAAGTVATREHGPPAVAEQLETRAELAAQLASLPLRYREAVVLRHVEDLAYEDIATALGRPTGTVKSDVHRGLALLRLALEREGYGEHDGTRDRAGALASR